MIPVETIAVRKTYSFRSEVSATGTYYHRWRKRKVIIVGNWEWLVARVFNSTSKDEIPVQGAVV